MPHRKYELAHSTSAHSTDYYNIYELQMQSEEDPEEEKEERQSDSDLETKYLSDYEPDQDGELTY